MPRTGAALGNGRSSGITASAADVTTRPGSDCSVPTVGLNCVR